MHRISSTAIGKAPRFAALSYSRANRLRADCPRPNKSLKPMPLRGTA